MDEEKKYDLQKCLFCGKTFEHKKRIKTCPKCKDGGIMRIIADERAICPFCGSENVDYDHKKGFIEDGDGGYYIMICLDCKKTSKEYYNLQFIDTVGDE